MYQIPRTMRASVLRAPGDIAIEERPVPAVAPDEVLVEVSAVGVCGSDAHYYHDGRIGDFVVESPLVLGHEAAGTIVAVGADISDDRVGARVSIEPQHPDLSSRETLAGHYNLCPHMRFYGTPPVDGAFAEYVTIRSGFAFDVPDSVSDDAAALMEPLSVAIAAVRKGGVSAGQRVLVTGAGPIGVVVAQTAVAFGATTVVISDPDLNRGERATQFGPIDPVVPSAVADLGPFDVAIECSGAPAAMDSALRALRPAGTLVLVGMGPDDITVALPVLQNRELVVTGVFRYANTWPTAIELVRTGRVDLDRLVTGHYALEETGKALRAVSDSAQLKLIVNPQR